MKVEVKEFFPSVWDNKKKVFKGTVIVLIPELGIKINSVHTTKIKSGYLVHMPYANHIHSKTNERVRVPLLSFIDHALHKQFIQDVYDVMQVFMAEYESKGPYPDLFPPDYKPKHKKKVHKKPKAPQAPKAIAPKASQYQEVPKLKRAYRPGDRNK